MKELKFAVDFAKRDKKSQKKTKKKIKINNNKMEIRNKFREDIIKWKLEINLEKIL